MPGEPLGRLVGPVSRAGEVPVKHRRDSRCSSASSRARLAAGIGSAVDMVEDRGNAGRPTAGGQRSARAAPLDALRVA